MDHWRRCRWKRFFSFVSCRVGNANKRREKFLSLFFFLTLGCFHPTRSHWFNPSIFTLSISATPARYGRKGNGGGRRKKKGATRNGEYFVAFLPVALGSLGEKKREKIKKGNKRKERNRIDRNLIGLPLAHSIGKEKEGGGDATRRDVDWVVCLCGRLEIKEEEEEKGKKKKRTSAVPLASERLYWNFPAEYLFFSFLRFFSFLSWLWEKRWRGGGGKGVRSWGKKFIIHLLSTLLDISFVWGSRRSEGTVPYPSF